MIFAAIDFRNFSCLPRIADSQIVSSVDLVDALDGSADLLVFHFKGGFQTRGNGAANAKNGIEDGSAGLSNL